MMEESEHMVSVGFVLHPKIWEAIRKNQLAHIKKQAMQPIKHTINNNVLPPLRVANAPNRAERRAAERKARRKK